VGVRAAYAPMTVKEDSCLEATNQAPDLRRGLLARGLRQGVPGEPEATLPPPLLHLGGRRPVGPDHRRRLRRARGRRGRGPAQGIQEQPRVQGPLLPRAAQTVRATSMLPLRPLSAQMRCLRAMCAQTAMEQNSSAALTLRAVETSASERVALAARTDMATTLPAAKEARAAVMCVQLQAASAA